MAWGCGVRNITPKELLQLLEDRFGDVPTPVRDAWALMVEQLEGQRTYWTQSTARELRENAACEFLQGGASVTWVVAHLHMNRRTVERINRRRLQSRRRSAA